MIVFLLLLVFSIILGRESFHAYQSRFHESEGKIYCIYLAFLSLAIGYAALFFIFRE